MHNAWVDAHRDKAREFSKKYYYENRERMNQKSREWLAAHPSDVAEYHKLYNQDPEHRKHKNELQRKRNKQITLEGGERLAKRNAYQRDYLKRKKALKQQQEAEASV